MMVFCADVLFSAYPRSLIKNKRPCALIRTFIMVSNLWFILWKIYHLEKYSDNILVSFKLIWNTMMIWGIMELHSQLSRADLYFENLASSIRSNLSPMSLLQAGASCSFVTAKLWGLINIRVLWCGHTGKERSYQCYPLRMTWPMVSIDRDR